MAYVSLAQTPEERAKAGPKSGGNASAIISMDPTGTVTVQLDSTPNGQGHATVTAQIVAEALGITPEQVDVVTEIDTLTSAWSIGSGNYSNRFAASVTDAIAKGADRVAMKLKLMAADQLECAVEDVELADGVARVAGSDRALPIGRVAAAAHWDPVGLPEGVEPGIHETAIISPALTAPTPDDRVKSSVTYGSVFDLVALEVDRDTGRINIDKYVSVHDVGEMMNPLIVEGQILGGFVHGLGGALMEELAYDEDGNFLSGTFADYLCPTAPEVPHVIVGHVTTRSPYTTIGAKGLGDGSSMLTPAAVTNAVADALGRDDISPPLTMPKVWRAANDGAKGENAS
jgi:2-furoyl-CoA dehydrogenase large subunit